MIPRPTDGQKRWSGVSGRRALPSVAVGALMAVVMLGAGGCVMMPRTTDSSGQSPEQTASEPARTTGFDQSRSSDSGSEFHATTTSRQQFQVHIDFGRAFEAQGNLDAALKEYQDALAVIQAKRRGPFRPSDEALAHRRIASAMDRMGRFPQAETHYNQALKLSPKDARIWNDAGYSYYLQGRWADSERALRAATRFAPDDERIRVNLGLTLAAAGRTDEALPFLSQASGDAIGHANLGYLLAASGQLDLARQQYETALAMRPDLQVARRALARLDAKEPGAHAPGARPAVMASGTRSTAHPLDSSVTRASTAPAAIQPPLPARTLPAVQGATAVSRPAIPAPSSRLILPPLPAP